jgi:hypothetical protein
MREATEAPSYDHQTQMKQRQFIMEKKKMTRDWAVNGEEATLGGRGNGSPMAMEQIWQEKDEHGRAEMERRSRSAKGTVDVANNDSSYNNSDNNNNKPLDIATLTSPLAPSGDSRMHVLYQAGQLIQLGLLQLCPFTTWHIIIITLVAYYYLLSELLLPFGTT